MIVPRRNVLVVRERVSPYGEIVTPLAEEDVQRAARMIKKRGIEFVAVVYIDSFMNPVHELRTREILRRESPDLDITLSHEVLPQMLEFERTCTTVLNAYVSPILKNYLQGLADRLKADWGYDGAILVTTSGGGVIGMDEALKLPARTEFSLRCLCLVGLPSIVALRSRLMLALPPRSIRRLMPSWSWRAILLTPARRRGRPIRRSSRCSTAFSTRRKYNRVCCRSRSLAISANGHWRSLMSARSTRLPAEA